MQQIIPTRARNLWSILGGWPGRATLALVGEAGGNLAHQDEGHGGEDGGRVEAAGEADGKDERDPDGGPGQDTA
jgi:hypothetical protein